LIEGPQTDLNLAYVLISLEKAHYNILKNETWFGPAGSENACGLNFINVLHTAFGRADPKSVKRY